MELVMKNLVFLFVAISIALALSGCANKYAVREDAVDRSVSIIPLPSLLEVKMGELMLQDDLKIVANSSDQEVRQVAEFLAAHLRIVTGFEVPVVDKAPGKCQRLFMDLTTTDSELGVEGYTLTVNEQAIRLSAGAAAGLFYGVQTLMQCLPAAVYADEKQPMTWRIPCVEIRDIPRFRYRGMHLDVCRHFFPIEFIKKYIDLLALHKMNVFHWHLTDDQGWRIEIKKYPELTRVSAFREQTLIGHPGRGAEQYDGVRYGGYYTQDEIKEIVRYAQERFVTIIPEIEMPGHALAALAAYPELSCTGGSFAVGTTWGVFDDVFCAGNDQVFHFMEDVLTEVVGLFPGEYVHIGGDECPKTRWQQCEKCQARIRQEGLKDEHELQSYFIRRMEKFLSSKGKRLIGWDEILEGGLAPQATVMSWRGVDGGIAAAQQGHDVIMTPNSHLYFDHYQADPQSEPLAIGGYTTLKKVYDYEPMPPELSATEQKYILGARANVWTEYIKTSDQVEYMVLPRMCALAEVVWTAKEKKNWPDFQRRLHQEHRKRLDILNYRAAEGSFEVAIMTDYDDDGLVYIDLQSEQYRPAIFYTIDGTEPTSNSIAYQGRFPLQNTTTIRAGIFQQDVLKGRVAAKTVTLHQGLGKMISYLQPFSLRYPGGGDPALLDGLLGSGSFNDGHWQGFHGHDMEVVVDLGRVCRISEISTGFIQNAGSWIFMPLGVDYAVSIDGQAYQSVAALKNDLAALNNEIIIRRFSAPFSALDARYVKVVAQNRGTCPEGHPGAGGKAWLFADEIIIQ
ncbi:MAG: beta-N-acetylhexosaminidase [Calditrichaeota bacterium]|nr:MAG: beta-N-acetylhexosaminidase [Calditrichota bacterium]